MKPNFELRKRLADRIITDLEEYQYLDRANHFQHIALNTLCSISLQSSKEQEMFPIQDLSEEMDKFFRKDMIYLRRYLNLLKNFPDFRRGELSDIDGAFPDLQSKSSDYYKDGYESHREYFIDLARDRLRGRSSHSSPSILFS